MPKSNQEIVLEGWLVKLPPLRRNWRTVSPNVVYDSFLNRIFQRWKRRWFVLKHSGELPGQFFLEYYSGRNCRNRKGVIDLDQCDQVDVGLKYEFRKLNYSNLFTIKTPEKDYYLAAENEQEMNNWVESVCRVCNLKSVVNESTKNQWFLRYQQGEENVEDDPRPARLASATAPKPKTKKRVTFKLDEPKHSTGRTDENSDKSNQSIVINELELSGQYIPISECITGPLPLTPQELKNLDIRKIHERSESLICTSSDDQTKRTMDGTHFRACSALELSNDPKFYDMPRQLQPDKQTRHECYINLQYLNDSLHKRSPIVFNDEEQLSLADSISTSTNTIGSERGANVFDFSVNFRPERQYRKVSNCSLQPSQQPAQSGIAADSNPQLVPVPLNRNLINDKRASHNYLNLDTNKSSNDEDSKDEHLDETYDCPRSHILPKSKSPNFFRYPPESTILSRSSISSSSLSQSNSNLPSPLCLPEIVTETLPPLINRELKPTQTPPDIDRKLKPKNIRKTANEKSGVTMPKKPTLSNCCSTMTRKTTMMPSSSSSSSAMAAAAALNKFQYLDLDLSGKTSNMNLLPSSSSQTSLSDEKSSVIYKTVDFVKTEAFKLTKKGAEANRRMLSTLS